MSDTKQPKAVADSPTSLGKKGMDEKTVSAFKWEHNTETQKTDAGTVQLWQLSLGLRDSADPRKWESDIMTAVMGITINMARKVSW